MLLSWSCLGLVLLQIFHVWGAHWAGLTSSGHRMLPGFHGGEVAKKGQFPWQVVITRRTTRFFCGGSLVSHSFVLTAAHCIARQNPAKLLLLFGSLQRLESRVTRGAQKLIMHEGFDLPVKRLDHINDIGLIRLDSPLSADWAKIVSPIRLPRRAQASLPLDNEKVTLSGWFQSADHDWLGLKKLQWTKVGVEPLQSCASILNMAINWMINGSHICTDTLKGGGLFQGDSGGPLVWNDPDGVPRQIGVYSFGSPFPWVTTLKIFTRVSQYLDWIAANSDVVIEP